MDQIMPHDIRSSGPAEDWYEAKKLGAPFKVFLANGVEVSVDEKTGKTKTSIKDFSGLISAVVRRRVLHPRKMSGDDLKFIRSAMGLKSGDVASALDLTPEHYSRCETGPKTMSAATEKHYRMHIFLLATLKDWNVQESAAQKSVDAVADVAAAKKALDAFRKLFLGMKIDPVFDPSAELSFVFQRCLRTAESLPCGGDCDDDGEWDSAS